MNAQSTGLLRHRLQLPVLTAALSWALLSQVGLTAESKSSGTDSRNMQQGMEFMQNMFGGQQSGKTSNSQANLKTIQRLLSKERNITVWESRGKIFLEGRVTSETMRERVQKVLTVFGNVVDLTEYQPDMDTFLADMELIKEKIEESLNRDYKPEESFAKKQEVSVNMINDKIVIAGELNTEADVNKALDIAKIYNENIVSNMTVSKQMVEVAAIFAKMNQDKSVSLGSEGLTSAILTLPTLSFGSPSDAAETSSPTKHFNQFRYSATDASLTVGDGGDVTMNFFRSLDKSAVLARPHLATVNGQSANFLAGGEKAYETTSDGGTTTEFKEYGVILETTPTLTTEGRINLALTLEFSVPDANGEDFVTFRHEGQAILSRSQGLVVSGLINEARSRGITETPFLGNVPILKFFFSKTDNVKEVEDLVLIVIPRVPGRVNKAPYPAVEETGKTPEQAWWVHKPTLGERFRSTLRGEKLDWKEGAEVKLLTPEDLDKLTEESTSKPAAGSDKVPGADPVAPDTPAAGDSIGMPPAPAGSDAGTSYQPGQIDGADDGDIHPDKPPVGNRVQDMVPTQEVPPAPAPDEDGKPTSQLLEDADSRLASHTRIGPAPALPESRSLEQVYGRSATVRPREFNTESP